MKLLSEAGEYALRAVVWMAQQPDRPHKVKDIAADIQAAPGYLVKVLQELAKCGILSGRRGSRGGFMLQRDPASLSILEIISAVDPVERITTCPLGLASHGRRLCRLHRQMDDALASIEESFRATMVSDLLDSDLRDGSASGERLCRALVRREVDAAP